MHFPHKVGAVALTAAATTLALAAGPAGAQQLHGANAPHRHHPVRAGADVFVQTDNPAGNAIKVYARASSGQLALSGSFATHGRGGQTGGSTADHLSSQNSLVYDAAHRELFAVNAGSNTISAFEVDGRRLRLRQVIGSGGTFPVSVAVHGNLAYVLNAFNGGSIQGYRLSGGRLMRIPGSSRKLGLNPALTPQFVNTPGDIAFARGGRDLLITTKANTNSIDVFSINRAGRPATAPVVNSEPGNTVPFALALERNNQVAVGEAGTSAVATFTLKADGTLTPLSTIATGQQATCWLISDGLNLFAGNAGSNSESVIADTPSGMLRLTQTQATDAGTIDATTSPDGRYLYVQTGVAGTVDEYHVGVGGKLAQVGSVNVPHGVGQEGIAAS